MSILPSRCYERGIDESRARRGRCLIACALVAALSSGCSHVGAGGGEGALHPWTRPDTVRIGLYEEPDSLNPVISSMAFSSDVEQLVYSGLVAFDDRGRAIPDLAREVPSLANGGISRDGRTLTYHLLKATWSDGVPLTARDVVYTWHAIMNPANNTATRTGYDRIAAIDAPDPQTVRVRFREPYPPAIYLFRRGNQGAILPEHILRGLHDLNRAPINSAPIGSGPYVVARWSHGSELRLDANPHYFRSHAIIPHVVLRFIPDQNTLLAQLRTHEIDLYYSVPLSQIEQVRALPDVTIAERSTLHWEHLNFNTQRPPLSERNVRLALCYGLDERAIYDKIYHGLGTAAPTHFNPDFGWGDRAVRYYPHDPRRAAALLDAAGWRLGADGTRRRGGTPLAFTLTTVAGVKQREALEVILQSEWRALGIAVAVKNAQAPTLFAPRGAGGLLYGGKTDAALFVWENTTPDPDDETYIAPDRLPPAGQNTSFYVNPAIAPLERTALATFDPARRHMAYAQIDRLLIADVPEYVLDWIPEITAANPDLEGVRPVPVGSDLWNAASWRYGSHFRRGG